MDKIAAEAVDHSLKKLDHGDEKSLFNRLGTDDGSGGIYKGLVVQLKLKGRVYLPNFTLHSCSYSKGLKIRG